MSKVALPWSKELDKGEPLLDGSVKVVDAEDCDLGDDRVIRDSVLLLVILVLILSHGLDKALQFLQVPVMKSESVKVRRS